MVNTKNKAVTNSCDNHALQNIKKAQTIAVRCLGSPQASILYGNSCAVCGTFPIELKSLEIAPRW